QQEQQRPEPVQPTQPVQVFDGPLPPQLRRTPQGVGAHHGDPGRGAPDAYLQGRAALPGQRERPLGGV
ncbi:AraC family transcriptional regulator, partial [Streptomyces sp. ZG43]